MAAEHAPAGLAARGADAGHIEHVFRTEYGRAVAVLVRVFGDIDIAEEAVQDAFTAALERWPASGPPPSPAGWIITTARNRAIDRLRREASRADRHAQAALLHAREEPGEEDAEPDDRLRLIFTCCHPALATEAQVALTCGCSAGSPPPRSPAPSSCLSRRWPSGWCEPRARSATVPSYGWPIRTEAAGTRA